MFRSAIPAALALCLISVAPAQALECPSLTAFNSPATADAVAKILPAGIDLDAPDAAASAIYELRQAGIADDMILDNLIATQCAAVIAEPGLSDAEKEQRVRDFTTWVEPLIYGQSN